MEREGAWRGVVTPHLCLRVIKKKRMCDRCHWPIFAAIKTSSTMPYFPPPAGPWLKMVHSRKLPSTRNSVDPADTPPSFGFGEYSAKLHCTCHLWRWMDRWNNIVEWGACKSSTSAYVYISKWARLGLLLFADGGEEQ